MTSVTSSGIRRRRRQRRPYSSALRSQQEELTRSRISAAVGALIRDGHIHSFTVEDVAQRAGVSYASVYRHFPSREKLLEALYESFTPQSEAPPLPASLGELAAFGRGLVRVWEANADVVRGGTVAMTALSVVPKTQRAHDDAIRELVADAAPGLSPDEIRIRTAALRYVVGSLAWTTLRWRFGLSADETATAMDWAIASLVHAIGRDAAAAGAKPTSMRKGRRP
jgi:AcrR family transcriptional regulator